MTFGLATAAAAFAVWIYLIGGRGGFWRAAIREEEGLPPDPVTWPEVVAVVPARDEADVIGASLSSLLGQDYPGPFRVILVDDQSRDGTATVARETATAYAANDRLTVLSGRTPPAGWTGKVWAMQQGVEWIARLAKAPRYVLFTDADVVYDRAVLRRLVARAESGGRCLVPCDK